MGHQKASLPVLKPLRLSMSVVGGGGKGPPQNQKQSGFIISPRIDAFEAEMIIIDNFNQVSTYEYVFIINKNIFLLFSLFINYMLYYIDSTRRTKENWDIRFTRDRRETQTDG
jgi:hypothetical protein